MSWNRTLSGLLSVFYVLSAFYVAGAETACIIGIGAVLPLACIWFSDAMGGYIGPTAHGAITGPTTGVFICLAGWLLLVLPLVIEIVDVFIHSFKGLTNWVQ